MSLPSGPGRGAGKRVLMLATEAHGGYGGISVYNIDVVRALADDPRISEIVLLPRLLPGMPEGVPDRARLVAGAAEGAGSYLTSVLRQAVAGGRFDLVYCAHINLVPLAFAAARLLRAPWLLAMYGCEVWQPTPRAAANRLAGRADLYLSISQLTLDRFRGIWPVDPARCALMPNAIDLSRFGEGPKRPDLLARYGLEGRTVLMTLGRMAASEQAKGFDRVIELLPRLAERVPDIAYLICGKGDDQPRLEALAAERGVRDRVRFAGMVPEEEKADHYRLADLYVMPSVMEGFGFVFLEALACGTPVVASAVDGGREAVLDGALGQIVDPFDPAALEQAICRGLEQPRGIPPGLSHFEFPRFRDRLCDALTPLLR